MEPSTAREGAAAASCDGSGMVSVSETLAAHSDTVSGGERGAAAGAAAVGSGNEVLGGVSSPEEVVAEVVEQKQVWEGAVMDIEAVEQETVRGVVSEQDVQARTDAEDNILMKGTDGMNDSIVQQEAEESVVVSELDVQARVVADKVAADGMAVEDYVSAQGVVASPETEPIVVAGQEVPVSGDNVADAEMTGDDDDDGGAGCQVEADSVTAKGSVLALEAVQSSKEESVAVSELHEQAWSDADKVTADGMAVEDYIAVEGVVAPSETELISEAGREVLVSGDNVQDAEMIRGDGDDAGCQVEKDSAKRRELSLEAAQSSKEEGEVLDLSNGSEGRALEDESSKGKVKVKGTIKKATMKMQDSDIEHERDDKYLLPPEDDKDVFGISDLVWGKVKSHPWWPGEIFDPSHASEMALKHQKEGKFLVAYFGDKSFAWNEEFMLKPFYKHFSQMEKQSNHRTFLDAVDAALSEVTRRIEVGMTCSCFGGDDLAALKHQKIENAGLRKGTCSSSVDRSMVTRSFEPDRILDFIKAVAQCPLREADKLDLVIAKAQLKALNHSKGYSDLPLFHDGGGLMETDAEGLPSVEKDSGTGTVETLTSVYAGSTSGRRKRGRPPSKQKHISDGTDRVDPLTSLAAGSRSGKRKRDRAPSKQKPISDGMDRVDPLTSVASGSGSGKRKRGRPSKKQKYISEDGRKKKKLSELVDEKEHLANEGQSRTRRSVSGSPDKKREADSYTSPDRGKHKKKRLNTLGDLDAKTPSPRSAKVGERMRRVACQMTGSPPILKSDGEIKGVPKMNRRRSGAFSVDGITNANTEASGTKAGDVKVSSPNEMLPLLCFAARNPLKGFSSLPDVISFFEGFRSSVLSGLLEDMEHYTSRDRKSRRRTVKSKLSSVETSMPDYIQDSYWADVVFRSSSDEEEKLPSGGRKRKGKSQSRGRKKKMKLADEGPSLPYPSDSVLDAAEDREVCVVDPLMEQGFAEGNSRCNLDEKLAAEHLRLDAMPDVQACLADTCTKQEMAEGRMVNDPEKRFTENNVTGAASNPDLQKGLSDPCIQESTESRSLSSIGGTITEESSRTALILSFTESDALPSETDLIDMFSSFGPLEETETEVLKESGRAKVVFKKHADAELAFISAGKRSLFGPALVSYRLRQQVTTAKSSLDTKQDNRDTLLSEGGVDLKVPDAGMTSDGAKGNTLPTD